MISLVKYWYRLVNLSNESKLLDDAYICSKNVANEDKQSWFLFTEKFLKLLVFRINLDFLNFKNFINLQKLVKNCYMKNM